MRSPYGMVYTVAYRKGLGYWIAFLTAIMPSAWGGGASLQGQAGVPGYVFWYEYAGQISENYDSTQEVVTYFVNAASATYDGQTLGARWVVFDQTIGLQIGNPLIVGQTSLHVTPGHTMALRLEAYNGGWHTMATANTVAGAQPTKKVLIKYFNDKDYAVRIRIVDNEDPQKVFGETMVEPHTGLLQEYTLQSPLGDETEEVTVLVLTDGIGFDGTAWVAEEGAAEIISARQDVPVEIVPTQQSAATTEQPVDEPENLPEEPVSVATVGQGAWVTTPETSAGEILDKQTFRQGVDKLGRIIANINTGGGSSVTVDTSGVIAAVNEVGAKLQGVDTLGEPEESSTEAMQAKDGILHGRYLGLFPPLPNITLPTKNSVLVFPMGKINGTDYSATLDFSQWSGPIDVFRGLASAAMFVIFSIVYIRTIKGAFSG